MEVASEIENLYRNNFTFPTLKTLFPAADLKKMKQFDFSNYNLRTKIYWSVMLCLSLIALGFAIYKIAGFSFVEFLFLGGSLVVSLLINKYQFNIKGTQTAVSAKELVRSLRY